MPGPDPADSMGGSKTKGMLRAAVGVDGGKISSVFQQISGLLSTSRVRLPGGAEPGLIFAEVDLPEAEGKGAWRLIALGHEILAVVTDCVFNSERRGLVVADDLVELHFILEGPVGLSVTGDTERRTHGVSLLACFPTDGFSYDIWCTPGSVRTLTLYVHPDYISRDCGMGLQRGSVLHRLLMAAPGTMEVSDQHMSVDFMDRLHQLFSMRSRRSPDLLRMGAILLELTCQALAVLDTTADDGAHSQAFRARDLALFAAARSALERDFTGQVQIADLARQLGTNATKLKNGFRLFYGMSMGGFRTRARMNHAMKMLVEDKDSVAVVAKAIGFRHQASLTVAFRSYFGITPKAARALKNAPSPDPARDPATAREAAYGSPPVSPFPRASTA